MLQFLRSGLTDAMGTLHFGLPMRTAPLAGRPALYLLTVMLPLLPVDVSGAADPFPVPADLARKTDSLFFVPADTMEQQTIVKVLKDTSVIYYAATYLTVPHSLAEVEQRLNDPPAIARAYRFTKRVEDFPQSDSGAAVRTMLLVMGVAFSNGWFLCDFQPIRPAEGGTRVLEVRRATSDSLNRAVRKKEKGLFTVAFNRFSIKWRFQAVGPNRTRMSMVAIVDPDVWIPQWLFRVTAKIMFPGMQADFARSLNKRPATPQ